MLIAVLFTTTKWWKQPCCPSTEEWVKKCGVEFYSAIRKNEDVSLIWKWTQLKIIISQSQTNTTDPRFLYRPIKLCVCTYNTKVKATLSGVMKGTNAGWKENWRRIKGCEVMIKVHYVLVWNVFKKSSATYNESMSTKEKGRTVSIKQGKNKALRSKRHWHAFSSK